MTEKMIAFCGLDCAACPAFHAAERRTMAERQQTAEDWGKQFNYPFKAADIDCVGCTARTGIHVGYCSMCEIRKCGLAKKPALATCAACPEYGCEKLEGFLKNVPQARTNLEALRR